MKRIRCPRTHYMLYVESVHGRIWADRSLIHSTAPACRRICASGPSGRRAQQQRRRQGDPHLQLWRGRPGHSGTLTVGGRVTSPGRYYQPRITAAFDRHSTHTLRIRRRIRSRRFFSIDMLSSAGQSCMWGILQRVGRKPRLCLGRAVSTGWRYRWRRS